jgi:hypothetical protein
LLVVFKNKVVLFFSHIYYICPQEIATLGSDVLPIERTHLLRSLVDEFRSSDESLGDDLLYNTVSELLVKYSETKS